MKILYYDNIEARLKVPIITTDLEHDGDYFYDIETQHIIEIICTRDLEKAKAILKNKECDLVGINLEMLRAFEFAELVREQLNYFMAFTFHNPDEYRRVLGWYPIVQDVYRRSLDSINNIELLINKAKSMIER